MRARRATLQFVVGGKGGRSRPPAGRTYVAIARVLGDPHPEMAWSMEFTFDSGEGAIRGCLVRYLSDRAPEGLLLRTRRFAVYEGPHLVARGDLAGERA